LFVVRVERVTPVAAAVHHDLDCHDRPPRIADAKEPCIQYPAEVAEFQEKKIPSGAACRWTFRFDGSAAPEPGPGAGIKAREEAEEGSERSELMLLPIAGKKPAKEAAAKKTAAARICVGHALSNSRSISAVFPGGQRAGYCEVRVGPH
jgi:hypothetical protein